MKTTIVSMILGSLVVGAFADPSPEGAAFLSVPQGLNITLTETLKVIPDANIPKKLLAELKKHIFGGPPYGVDPDTYRGFTHDINGDGTQEYFIYYPDASGSGGKAFVIYALLDSSWKRICSFQGPLYKMPSKEGWPALVNIGRGGGGHFSKSRLEFKNGSYITTSTEDYVDRSPPPSAKD